MRPWLRTLTGAAAGLTLLGAAAFALVPRTLRAADLPAAAPNRTISVTGRASADVRPDTARLTFGVSILAPTATDAYAKMSQNVGDVVAAMKALNVAEADMQTSGLALYAEYQYDKDNQQHLTGYRASNNITVRSKRLDGLGALIDAAVNSGANSLSGVEFYVSNAAEVSRSLLDQATDDARAKANQVAARLGAVVTGATQVTVMDDGGSPAPIYNEGGLARAGAAPLPVMSGTSRVQAAVSVQFSLADAPPASP